MRLFKTTLLTAVLCAAAAAAPPAGRPVTPDGLTPEGVAEYTLVHGYCLGQMASGFTSFVGTVYGDMEGVEHSTFVLDTSSMGCMLELRGKTTIKTDHGELFVIDRIQLNACPVPGMAYWNGTHQIIGGTDEYCNCFGEKVTSGMINLLTGRVAFSYSGGMWVHGLFGPKPLPDTSPEGAFDR